jgi:hypothetical protein
MTLPLRCLLRLRWIFSLVVIPLTQGCVTGFPKESDITGTWEGIGPVYVLFEYENPGKAHMVVGNIDVEGGEERFVTGRLSDFVSRESDFTLAITLDDEGETITEVMRGEVYGSHLLLHFEEDGYEDDELSVWLIKSNELDASRVAARNSLNVFLGTEN